MLPLATSLFSTLILGSKYDSLQRARFIRTVAFSRCETGNVKGEPERCRAREQRGFQGLTESCRNCIGAKGSLAKGGAILSLKEKMLNLIVIHGYTSIIMSEKRKTKQKSYFLSGEITVILIP